jgi:hypothetical protein
VLQGDGIDYRNIQQILEAVLAAGYSAEAVAFGMGGGLLQKVNRDTLSLAAKLSHVVYADGSAVDVMKAPKTGPEKGSLPGVLAVKRVGGVPTVFPAEEVAPEENLLRVVYDRRPVEVQVGCWGGGCWPAGAQRVGFASALPPTRAGLCVRTRGSGLHWLPPFAVMCGWSLESSALADPRVVGEL